MNPQVAEYSIQRNYLDLFLDLPWNHFSVDNLDLKRAQKILDRDHFGLEDVKKRIIYSLELEGFKNEREFIVIKVPNITDISYGRGVGYTFTEHDLGEEIHKISATKIRKTMRDNNELD